MDICKLNESLTAFLNEWEEGDETYYDDDVPTYSANNVKMKLLVRFPDGEEKEMVLPVDIHDAHLSNAKYCINIYGVDAPYAVNGWDGDIEYDEDNLELSDDAYDLVPDGTVIVKFIEEVDDGILWDEHI